MSPSKWLFFPSPAAGGLGDPIVTNGRSITFVGGVESRINSDGDSTVYNSWTLGNMDFRDASKNDAWTDGAGGAQGILWGMADSTNYANWQGYIGTGGGTFSVYATGTTTLIFSLEYSGERQWTTNTRQYGHTGVDYTGRPSDMNERVDVYHVQA